MSNAWDVGNALGTLATAVIASMVFVEARSIRQMEWLSRSMQMWQNFNQMMMDGARAARWRRLLAGDLPAEEFRAEDHYVLFTYVNILFAEYEFARRKLIKRDYALESVADNVRQLGPSSELIVPLLRMTGYDNEFVDLIEEVAERGDAGARRWITTRRSRLPWRRPVQRERTGRS